MRFLKLECGLQNGRIGWEGLDFMGWSKPRRISEEQKGLTCTPS